MKNNAKITSLKRLRKEKARVALQIQQEKTEIISEVEKYKNSLWPFRVLHRWQKTIESISENKLVAIGAQLAYSFLHTKRENKNEESVKEENASGEKKEKSVFDFLKNVASNFLEMYVKPEKGEE